MTAAVGCGHDVAEIRRQVAEEIARALDAEAAETRRVRYFAFTWDTYAAAARTARQVGGITCSVKR